MEARGIEFFPTSGARVAQRRIQWSAQRVTPLTARYRNAHHTANNAEHRHKLATAKRRESHFSRPLIALHNTHETHKSPSNTPTREPVKARTSTARGGVRRGTGAGYGIPRGPLRRCYVRLSLGVWRFCGCPESGREASGQRYRDGLRWLCVVASWASSGPVRGPGAVVRAARLS